MKKIFSFVSILSVVILLASCNQNAGEMIIGTWDNTVTEVSNLDEVADALFNANKVYLEQQKDLYAAQMVSMDDSSKLIYEQIISSIDEQIASLNLDTIKANIVDNYDIGTFVFNVDSSLVIKAMDDSVVGTWSINADETILKLMIQGDEIPLNINEISKSKLIIVQESSIDSLKFEIKYTFEK
ncbi:MAG: hypothetical protein JXR68_08975 [Bacteroidales bacterium]|nr:hypothetical protein [Bacteroidales bacterium]